MQRTMSVNTEMEESEKKKLVNNSTALDGPSVVWLVVDNLRFRADGPSRIDSLHSRHTCPSCVYAAYGSKSFTSRSLNNFAHGVVHMSAVQAALAATRTLSEDVSDILSPHF